VPPDRLPGADLVDAAEQNLADLNPGTEPVLDRLDPAGNRLVLNENGELTTSTYDPANRLVTSEDDQGLTQYTFDADGNQRTVETPAGEITTYSWNYENQLAQLEQADETVVTYMYAPVTKLSDELRLSKETEAGTVRYVWDNQNIIQEQDETGFVEAAYTLNPQPYGDLVSQHRDAESSFYHYDALGSTESLTDPSGTQTDEYVYAAFGEILAQTGTTENLFTWIGEQGYAKDGDDVSIRARIYGTLISRFRSQDPKGFLAGDPNEYRYVQNNPVNSTDPSGASECELKWKGKTIYWCELPKRWWSTEFCTRVGDHDSYSCVTRWTFIPKNRRKEYGGRAMVPCKVHYKQIVEWVNTGRIRCWTKSDDLHHLFRIHGECGTNLTPGCKQPQPKPKPTPQPESEPEPEPPAPPLPPPPPNFESC
jgi:RHS repeat-associated protein